MCNLAGWGEGGPARTAPHSHPRFRGHSGWGKGLSCSGRARRGCRTISSPAGHLQPQIPLLQACPLGTKPAQPCAQQESGGLAPNASGQLLRRSEPPLSWTHFPKSLQPAHYWRLITHLRRQARAPAQPRSAGSKDPLPSLPQLSAPLSAGDSQQEQGSAAEAQPRPWLRGGLPGRPEPPRHLSSPPIPSPPRRPHLHETHSPGRCRPGTSWQEPPPYSMVPSTVGSHADYCKLPPNRERLSSYAVPAFPPSQGTSGRPGLGVQLLP